MKLALPSLVLACVCAAAAAVAVYVRVQLLETSRYVAVVAPLASNAAVQRAVVSRVEREISTAVAVPPESQPQLHAILVEVVASDRFREVWTAANRVAHEQLVKVLTGRGAVTIQGDAVVLDLGGVVQVLRQELERRGFPILEETPPSLQHISFPIVDSSAVGHVRTGVRALDAAAIVLPLVALGLLLLAIVAWPRRLRGVTWSAVGLGLTAGALLGALVAARSLYLNEVPASLLPRDAAAAIFDALVNGFWTSLWVALGVSAAVAVATVTIAAMIPRRR